MSRAEFNNVFAQCTKQKLNSALLVSSEKVVLWVFVCYLTGKYDQQPRLDEYLTHSWIEVFRYMTSGRKK